MSNLSSDDYYKDYYQKVFNSGVVSKMSDQVHKFIESPYKNSFFPVILEVGAGQGQHFNFVTAKFNRYIELDLRDTHDSMILGEQHIFICGDAEELNDFADASIDRLIATCLLAHLPNPEKALSEWSRVLKQHGVMDIYVPCEPGLLLRALRRVVTIPKSKKIGVDHKAVHYREHRNMWILCDLLIRENFKNDLIKISKFPIGGPFWNLRLFDIYRIRKIS